MLASVGSRCSDQTLGVARLQLSPHRREVFCEGLFLVLKLSPHMSARTPAHRHQHCCPRPRYVTRCVHILWRGGARALNVTGGHNGALRCETRRASTSGGSCAGRSAPTIDPADVIGRWNTPPRLRQRPPAAIFVLFAVHLPLAMEAMPAPM